MIAVKGVGGFDRSSPVDGPTFVEVTERGHKIRRGVQLWKVAVSVIKSETYRYLRLAPPTDEEVAAGGAWPSGFVHIPRGITSEWVRQLTAEQLVTIKTRHGFPKLEWQKTRDRNEALDNRVYARAAAWLMGLDRWDEPRWEQMELQLDPAPQPGRDEAELAGRPNAPLPKIVQQAPKLSGWMGPRRGKWF